MGIGLIGSSQLDSFVSEIDKMGGPSSAESIAHCSDFQLVIDAVVDQTLDPFSESYVSQQISVYNEISGRVLDQVKFEQLALDTTPLIRAPNPYGSKDTQFIAKHCRAVLTSVSLANLPPGAAVLDMGCGWGLSSEMFAYCGATVTGVDINPQFVDLVNARTNGRHFSIEAHQSEFDVYRTSKKFDLVFFYECLHHAIKPWETLKNVADFVNVNGKIVIAGEPINDFWWKDWGIRLDPLSVYCIRKFGWFESGWSTTFLSKCFQYAGMSLELYHGVGLDGGAIGVGILPGGDPSSPYAKAHLNSMQESERLRQENSVQQKELIKLKKLAESLVDKVQEFERREAVLKNSLRYYSANPMRALKLWWKR